MHKGERRQVPQIEAVRWMGIDDAGAVRTGLSVYTDAVEVDWLLTALAEVAG